MLSFILSACSSKRFIPDGEHLLESAKVTSTDPAVGSAGLTSYMRQLPNSKWFSALKVPMGTYLLQHGDSSRWFNRMLRRVGEAPVIYDTTLSQRTIEDMRAAVVGMGYLNAKVSKKETVRKHKIKVEYIVEPGMRTYIRDVQYEFPDSTMHNIYFRNIGKTFLRTGIPLDLNILDQERSQTVNIYQTQGYYKFNRTYIHYLADTTRAIGTALVKLQVLPFKAGDTDTLSQHTIYTIDSISYSEQARRTFRRKVLERANRMKRGEIYNEQTIIDTYERLSRLGNVVSSAIHFNESEADSSKLIADIAIGTAKQHSLQLLPEATNTAGDFGAALGLTYQNRNIFKGGETFSFKIRTAYEAVKNLQGYVGSGYFEYSAEATLRFPVFKFLFLSKYFRENSIASTEVNVMYDSQDRPEFHRRVLTAALRYRWSKYNNHMQHKLDLLDLNYIFMPWISDTFRQEYLDDASSRNAILRYNYENLFIMKAGYTYSYASRPLINGTNKYRTTSYSLRASIETAGNLLSAISAAARSKKNADGYRHIFDIAFAQYIKGDFDFSKSYKIDERNAFAFHTYLGVAVPYGNSNILPYEKRYFSGGANSVRGWSVRSLGPGSFKGTDGRIDFINQTGDIKLDLSIELRTKLFWKMQGALFVDAGNIWTLRSYDEQPGGQFRFDTFWKQIAVAYGLGIRLNFDYFIIRLDGGMKAIDPAYEDSKGHYPIIRPRISRDFTLHFAIGLPF